MPSRTDHQASKPSRFHRVLLGWAVSTAAFVAWKVVDTPVLRQLERQVSPEMLRHLQSVVDVAIAAGVVVSTCMLLMSAYRVRTIARSGAASQNG